jgi:hypothetical protein
MSISIKTRIRRRITLLVFLTAVVQTSAKVRTWEDRQGTRFEAEFVRELFGTGFFKAPDGKSFSVDTKELSAKDVQYIRTQIPPDVKIDFSKNEQDKKLSTYARPDDRVTIVSATITVEQTSRAPFFGKLTAEIYLVSKEVATPDFRLLAKETRPVRFTEENRGRDTVSVTTEVRRYLEYNSQVRGAQFAGYVALVFGPQGDQIAWSTDLPWLREEDLHLFRELKQGEFFDENCWKMPVPRPEYYIERRIFR